MKNKFSIVAIACLIVAIPCLIGVLYYSSHMSLSHSGATSVAAPLAVTTQAASISGDYASTSAQSSSSTAQSSPGRYIQVTDGITFEVVTSQATQEQGLSDRSSVPDNYAMLFIFPKDGTYGFWMKDMLVPLDMIWVTSSGSIAAIDSDVLPSSYPGVFYPPIPIRYVLETKAGFAQEKGWHVGTVVPLPISTS